jgi:multimeric flavodoxin WrbA
MQALVDKIERADAYIFAAPTNFGSVTAVFKRFMERLIVYGYWPWGMHAPKFRKAAVPKKKAILVSSCAAPGFIGRWVYGTHKQLNATAQTVGAKAVGTLFTGLVADEPDAKLSARVQAQIQKLAAKIP